MVAGAGVCFLSYLLSLWALIGDEITFSDFVSWSGGELLFIFIIGDV